MKYVLLVPDGAADDPLPELDGKTPLQVARTPHLDGLARKGRIGSVVTVPEGMDSGLDVANMALLGYNPATYYTGRGPLEAAAFLVPLSAKDVAFRCSLVSTDGEMMKDASAGRISTDEAMVLMELVQTKFGSRRFTFFPGVSFRHILRWTDGELNLKTTSPHEIQDKPLEPYLPVGDGEDDLRGLIYDSLDLLDNHPVNRRRRDEGKPAANMLWPWGQGRETVLPSFLSERKLTGAMITSVNLLRGLALCAGLHVIDVPNATGTIGTNLVGKTKYAVNALVKDGIDFVYLHIASPDTSSRTGDLEQKIRSIEDIDRQVVGPLVDGFKEAGEPFRLMVVPSHATPIALRTHRSGPVPFLFYNSMREADGKLPYDERALEDTRLIVEEGHRLIDLLLKP